MLMIDPIRTDADPAEARTYISSMAGELALMARQSGDRRLALLLDLAASFAELSERPRD